MSKEFMKELNSMILTALANATRATVPTTMAEAAEMDVLKKLLVEFKTAQTNTAQVKKALGAAVSEHHPHFKEFAANMASNGNNMEYFDSIGIIFIVLLRHYHVHFELHTIKFGSMINDKLGLSPVQLSKSHMQSCTRRPRRIWQKKPIVRWYYLIH